MLMSNGISRDFTFALNFRRSLLFYKSKSQLSECNICPRLGDLAFAPRKDAHSNDYEKSFTLYLPVPLRIYDSSLSMSAFGILLLLIAMALPR
jgi:hypothetical protein